MPLSTAARKVAALKVSQARVELDAEAALAKQAIHASAGELANQVVFAVLPLAAGGFPLKHLTSHSAFSTKALWFVFLAALAAGVAIAPARIASPASRPRSPSPNPPRRPQLLRRPAAAKTEQAPKSEGDENDKFRHTRAGHGGRPRRLTCRLRPWPGPSRSSTS